MDLKWANNVYNLEQVLVMDTSIICIYFFSLLGTFTIIDKNYKIELQWLISVSLCQIISNDGVLVSLAES